MLIPSRTPRKCGSLLLLLSPQGRSIDNIRNYLTLRGAPPWNFKDYSQHYVTPLTNKTSLTLGISGGSFEKKFENMRGRKSIGYELGVDVVENLVFPQA